MKTVWVLTVGERGEGGVVKAVFGRKPTKLLVMKVGGSEWELQEETPNKVKWVSHNGVDELYLERHKVL